MPNVCVCLFSVIVRILHNFQHFTQNFVAANLRKFMQLKVFSRIGLEAGEHREGGVCAPHVEVNWQHINFPAHIRTHTPTNTHPSIAYFVSVRQTETFYASAPQLFFGIKYLSCKWRVRKRENCWT